MLVTLTLYANRTAKVAQTLFSCTCGEPIVSVALVRIQVQAGLAQEPGRQSGASAEERLVSPSVAAQKRKIRKSGKYGLYGDSKNEAATYKTKQGD